MVSLTECTILTFFSKHSLNIFLTSSLSCQTPPVLQTPIRVCVIFGCKPKKHRISGTMPRFCISALALFSKSKKEDTTCLTPGPPRPGSLRDAELRILAKQLPEIGPCRLAKGLPGPAWPGKVRASLFGDRFGAGIRKISVRNGALTCTDFSRPGQSGKTFGQPTNRTTSPANATQQQGASPCATKAPQQQGGHLREVITCRYKAMPVEGVSKGFEVSLRSRTALGAAWGLKHTSNPLETGVMPTGMS